jgi:hypothetical protein
MTKYLLALLAFSCDAPDTVLDAPPETPVTPNKELDSPEPTKEVSADPIERHAYRLAQAELEVAKAELQVDPTPEPLQVEPPTKGWTHYSDTDAMSGKITKTALITSSNSHNFGFPYQGETFARLVMRTTGKQKDVMIILDQGQIVCHSYMNCKIQVRFDDAPAQSFRGSESSDNDPTLVFLSPESKFMVNAAKAKKIIIALTLYQEGIRIFEFDLAS